MDFLIDNIKEQGIVNIILDDANILNEQLDKLLFERDIYKCYIAQAKLRITENLLNGEPLDSIQYELNKVDFQRIKLFITNLRYTYISNGELDLSFVYKSNICNETSKMNISHLFLDLIQVSGDIVDVRDRLQIICALFYIATITDLLSSKRFLITCLYKVKVIAESHEQWDNNPDLKKSFIKYSQIIKKKSTDYSEI